MNKTNTPPMSDDELRTYIDDHLGNELKWLLRAATEWNIQNSEQYNLDGVHIQVYALDSAFLHARSLFEFFTKRATGDNYYALDAFSLAPIASSLYSNDWVSPLHTFSMHVQSRLNTIQLRSFDGFMYKDLNRMPVDFAMEIVRMWRVFITELANNTNPNIKNLAINATNTLKEAIEGANAVYGRNAFTESITSLTKEIVW